MKIEADLPEITALNLESIVIESELVTVTWFQEEDLPSGGLKRVQRIQTFDMSDAGLREALAHLMAQLLKRTKKTSILLSPSMQTSRNENPCTKCMTSRCCHSDYSDTLWVTLLEINALKNRLGDDVEKHIQRVPGGHWAEAKLAGYIKRDGYCPFLGTAENGQRRCSVYDIRPKPCRLGPERNCSLYEEKADESGLLTIRRPG